jgi:hypothetical protein
VPTQDQVTLTVRGVGATVTVVVPRGWRVRDQVLVLGRRQAIGRGDEGGSGPLLELTGVMVGGTYQLTDG